jgi:Mg2+-importing ATPase
MTVFGLLSSVFDLFTFWTLWFVFEATPGVFRTGWFVESLLTELLVALVVRTRGPFTQSRPGRVLLVSTLILIPITLAIPYLPYADVLGFEPLPPSLVGALLGITTLYVLATELTKRRFYASRLAVE